MLPERQSAADDRCALHGGFGLGMRDVAVHLSFRRAINLILRQRKHIKCLDIFIFREYFRKENAKNLGNRLKNLVLTMRFRSFDRIPIVETVVHLGSFSAAADALNLTKGAVSYQIRQLEDELGFAVFTRLARGIRLTARGEELLAASAPALETIQRKIDQLRQPTDRVLTIGVTTYFASRWLSPRLMEFMRMHPDIRLRIQPTVNVVNLEAEGLDLAIRWGCGDWSDVAVDPLFFSPAWPVGDVAARDLVEEVGVEAAFQRFTLLHDRDNSEAWIDWFALAGLPYIERRDTLVVPDPNVRVQAVIDGQGVAINDRLVDQELTNGQLFRLSSHQLNNYGYYLVLPTSDPTRSSVERFSDWLRHAV